VECQLIRGSVGAITFPYDIQMGLHGDCLLQRMGTGCNRLERGKVASWFLQLSRPEESQPHNTTLSIHHIPPPHLQVHERGKYMTYAKAVAASYSVKKKPPRTFIRLPPACLNQSSQPSKSRASQKSIRTTLSGSLAYSKPAQGPNRGTDGAPGDEIAGL
jgi:hypothetical protein